MIDAFTRRNPDAIEALLRTHNQRALTAYVELMLQQGHLNRTEGGC
jgi:hypothetical protein